MLKRTGYLAGLSRGDPDGKGCDR